jgi:hypothetical protein
MSATLAGEDENQFSQEKEHTNIHSAYEKNCCHKSGYLSDVLSKIYGDESMMSCPQRPKARLLALNCVLPS